MLIPIGNALVGLANFTASGAAATSITVSVDVWKIPMVSGSPSSLVTAASATHLGRGGFWYRLALSFVDSNALYVFAFYTSDTADQKTIFAGWSAGLPWVENVDQAITAAVAAILAKLPAALVSGRIDASVGAVANDALTAAALASSAVTEIQAGLALETTAQAVKTQTDKLAFTSPNKVDAAITSAGDFAQGAADKVWASAARTLTSFGSLAADVATGVWSAGTRTLTGFGTLVADVAAQVWNSVASAFTTPGTMGDKLNSAASAGDPWTTPLPGSYPDGSAGHILGTLETTDIELVSTVIADGVLPLVAGDAYTVEHGRALDDWALPGQPSLVDATVTLVIADVLEVEAISIGGAGTATQIPVFELTAEQTALLTRIGERTYLYQIHAVWPADSPLEPALLVEGDVTVTQRLTGAAA